MVCPIVLPGENAGSSRTSDPYENAEAADTLPSAYAREPEAGRSMTTVA